MTGRSFARASLTLCALLALGRLAPASPDSPRDLTPVAAIGSATLEVFPDEVRLDDQGDRAALVVQATLPDGTTQDVTADAALVLAAPGVARVDSSAVVTPLADGETTLTVRLGALERVVPVVVRGAARRRTISFVNDVLPVLTRSGCNTGSCHGTSRGKDGFHLSLFGYDPGGDHARIVREQVGRRVNLAAPEESLLVRKATGEARHTGGRRIDPGSEQHQALVAWLAAGAPADPAGGPRLTAIELRPARTVLLQRPRPERQRLSVRARYDDGSDRDVTSLTAFTTSDASVAAVGSDAVVAAAGRRGEAWITARFGDQVVAAQVLVVADDPGFTFPADEPDDHPVDRLVNDKLRRLRVRPAPLCDDATYLRRVTLDVTGRLPTVEEVEAFLADAAPDKRARVLDELLGRDAFVDLWTMLWCERLMVRSSGDRVSPKAALGYATWIEERVRGGVPLDQMVRELLTAQGSTLEAPATNFFHVEEDTKQLAENVAQAFLGLRIQCAQCHNHPFDRWTQDDYMGFAAFFARVGRKPGGDPRERIVFDRGGGELKHPVTGADVTPRFLGGEAPKTGATDRREVLARWLTAADNPWFAKNAANMVWAHLFGVGLVHEPDDARVSNPPSNPALLDLLAERLRDSGYDVRALVRLIVTSRAYQRASDLESLDEAAGGDRDHARGLVRRLRAELLLDAIAQATDAPDDFRGLPRGARAVELADGASTTDFLTTFGRAARESVCTCEVRVQPNLGQALHLLNGDTIHRKLKQGRVVPRLLKDAGGDRARVVRALYLRALSRPPVDEEVADVLAVLPAEGDPTAALEDVFWALLNSREFLFNH